MVDVFLAQLCHKTPKEENPQNLQTSFGIKHQLLERILEVKKDIGV